MVKSLETANARRFVDHMVEAWLKRVLYLKTGGVILRPLDLGRVINHPEGCHQQATADMNATTCTFKCIQGYMNGLDITSYCADYYV